MAYALYDVLPRYINQGMLSRRDALWALFPQQLFRRNARKVIESFQAFQRTHTQSESSAVRISVEVYTDENKHVLGLQDYIATHLRQDVLGAYVHGSLGTGEAITYSDFDALIILKDEVFETPTRLAAVASRLSKARSFMLAFDPLQHHGWFVLSEMQLRAYAVPYFPLELYRYAKSLLPDTGCDLSIRVQAVTPEAWKQPFIALSDSLIGRIARGNYPASMYELKFVLSQFMLLPAFYVQARDRTAVFKKHSFGRARADFSEREWAIMDEVSSLRTAWQYDLTAIRRWFLVRTSPALRRVTKRWAPRIPAAMRQTLSPAFYERMGRLAHQMRANIQDG